MTNGMTPSSDQRKLAPGGALIPDHELMYAPVINELATRFRAIATHDPHIEEFVEKVRQAGGSTAVRISSKTWRTNPTCCSTASRHCH